MILGEKNALHLECKVFLSAQKKMDEKIIKYYCFADIGEHIFQTSKNLFKWYVCTISLFCSYSVDPDI